MLIMWSLFKQFLKYLATYNIFVWSEQTNTKNLKNGIYNVKQS